jgi:hypothetical protein
VITVQQLLNQNLRTIHPDRTVLLGIFRYRPPQLQHIEVIEEPIAECRFS